MNDTEKPAVIIPAHDEIEVIGRLLEGLAPGARAGIFSVTVACNGCTDGTEAYVKEVAPFAAVISLKEASKVAAINAADRGHLGFPRAYIDADIEIASSDVKELLEFCRAQRGPAICVPTPVLDRTNASPIVCWFYDAWEKSTVFNRLHYGSGIYCLNREARSKFGDFPSIISDDGFIRTVVDLPEIHRCADTLCVVRIPADLKSLVAVKTRSKLGQMELERQGHRLPALDRSEGRFLTPPTMLEKLVYYSVNLCARVRAILLARRIAQYRWDRDESSRQPLRAPE